MDPQPPSAKTVMKAEVINLPWDTRRWRPFEKLHEKGLVQRVDAVVGKNLDLKELQAQGLMSMATARRIGRRLLTGQEILLGHVNEVGCMLSHTNQWRAMLADPDRDCALIMEDDIAATEAVIEQDVPALKAWLDSHRPGWDFVIMSPFGLLEMLWDWKVPPERVWDGVYVGRLGKWYGAGAYLVSRKGAELALAALFPMELQVDCGVCVLGEMGLLEVYGAFRSRVELEHPVTGEPQGGREAFVPLSLECLDSSLCHACMTLEVAVTALSFAAAGLVLAIVIMLVVLLAPPGKRANKAVQPAR